MSPDHAEELALLEISRWQREALQATKKPHTMAGPLIKNVSSPHADSVWVSQCSRAQEEAGTCRST